MNILRKLVENRSKKMAKGGGKTKDIDDQGRKIQFNTTISPNLVDGVRLLAATYAVPVWVVAEHAIQIGVYNLIIAAENVRKEKAVRNYLIKQHLLATELNESLEMMHINEAAYPERLIHSKPGFGSSWGS